MTATCIDPTCKIMINNSKKCRQPIAHQADHIAFNTACSGALRHEARAPCEISEVLASAFKTQTGDYFTPQLTNTWNEIARQKPQKPKRITPLSFGLRSCSAIQSSLYDMLMNP